MRAPAPASNTLARPIISDDAFHGADEIPHVEPCFIDTAFGRKRASVQHPDESADVIVAPHVRSQPAGAIPVPWTSPLAPVGALSSKHDGSPP